VRPEIALRAHLAVPNRGGSASRRLVEAQVTPLIGGIMIRWSTRYMFEDAASPVARRCQHRRNRTRVSVVAGVSQVLNAACSRGWRGDDRWPAAALPMEKENGVLKTIAIAAALAVLAAGCAGQGSQPARPSAAVREPRTAAALVKIATAFNSDYDTGVYGPVWDRWDARSQAVISRADYVRRHTECPDSPQSVRVEDASPGRGGAWIVDYEAGGVQLRDYWFYVDGRWVFDLVLSNPGSVTLYRLPAQQYIAALNCAR
jgi:hypothetical protein